MSIVKVNGQVNTTKVFATVIGATGPMGPPGPANTTGINVSNTTIDLDLIKTIIDENIGATFITVHSKPSNPQYTHTILLGEIPVSSDVQDYMAIITIGGQNTDADDNLNWQLTRNGVEVGSPGNTFAPGGIYWYFAASFAASPVAAGDVIGIKFWTDTSTLIDFAYATIYIVPQTLSVPAGMQSISSGDAYTQGLIEGAATGVTYRSSGTIVAPGFYDSALDAVVIGTFGSATISTFLTPLQAIHSAGQSYKTDDSRLASSANASPSLFFIAAGSFLRILQNYNFAAGTTIGLPNPAGNEGRILQVVNGVWTAV